MKERERVGGGGGGEGGGRGGEQREGGNRERGRADIYSQHSYSNINFKGLAIEEQIIIVQYTVCTSACRIYNYYMCVMFKERQFVMLSEILFYMPASES